VILNESTSSRFNINADHLLLTSHRQAWRRLRIGVSRTRGCASSECVNWLGNLHTTRNDSGWHHRRPAPI
jgi:hypothetical protein